jgi:hypothetical protein
MLRRLMDRIANRSKKTSDNNGDDTFSLNGRIFSAQDVAKNVYLTFVRDEPKDLFSRMSPFIRNNSPHEQHAAFEAAFLNKMQLYAEAPVLRLLIASQGRDKRYEPLLREFEKIIFSPRQVEGFQKLHAVKSAMTDLQKQADSPKLTWARDWLLGVVITRPIPRRS